MNIRRDCIHYHCEHEMGASIDCCSLRGLGKCPCSEDCAEYANRAEVYKMGLEAIKSKHTKHMADEQPTIEPQQRWIPCSERLPEKNGRYLVTRGLNAAEAIWNRVYIANYSDLMGLKDRRIFWQGNVGKSDFEKLEDVIAWMPLPESYTKEGDS